MDAGAGHPAARQLRSRVAPRAEEPPRVLVAGVAFDVHRLAEFARRDDTLHLLHVGPEPMVLAQAPGPRPDRRQASIARAASSRVNASGFSQNTGLRASADGDDLFGMQRVWRRQHHGLDPFVGQELGQRRRQGKAMTLSECRYGPDIATCAAHEAQAVALALDRLDEVLAPPAEANDASMIIA